MAGTATNAGGCWPTDDQTQLLRAAVLTGEEARAAWTRWRARNTPDTTDRGSTRLLPLVYRNIGREGLDDADLARLKGAYQAAWYQNQLLFRSTAQALRALHEAGIPTMLLKGVGLAVAHYRDAGVRPMLDADVLVPWHDAGRALAVLREAGWASEAGTAAVPGLATSHAEHLHDPSGKTLDLHRSALTQAGEDDAFWAAAVDVELLGVPTRTLCPSDHLLHAAAHGASWNAVPPVRWMADASTVARSAGGALDWERLVAEATRRRVTVVLTAALEHLADAVGLETPPHVLDRLRSAPKGRLERAAFRAATQPPGVGKLAPVMLDHYFRNSRLDPSLRFGDVLRDAVGARTGRELVRRVAHKAGEAAVARAAPRLVRTCTGCGRRVVRLRSTRPRLCDPCATAAKR
jgi:hypothetical protein